MGMHRLTTLARRQGGVVSVRQADDLGIPRSTLDGRLRTWGVAKPHRGVIALPGVDLDAPTTRLWLALCAVGSPAWASGRTAAQLHAGEDVPAIVDVAVPVSRRPSAPSGVRLRRLTLGHRDVTVRRWVPLLQLDRALREAAALEAYDEALGLVAAAVQRRATTLDRLAASTRGRRPGGRQLRAIVADLGATGADSALAHRTVGLLRAAGLSVTSEVAVTIRGGRTAVLDIVVDGTDVAIEVDGHAVHGRRRAASSDRRRGNELALTGRTILRVDWLRLQEDPRGFVAEVVAAVESAGPTPTGGDDLDRDDHP